MKYNNLANLSFNHIEVFLCAVESGSFNAVAQKMNYSQSMISKTISGLEKDLELILFLRGKTSNVLTPAGKSLYADWKSIFNQMQESLEKAQIIQTGMLSTLTVGCADTMIECPEIENMIRTFCNTCPSVSLEYEEYTLNGLLEKANQHKLDLIITAKHDIPTLEESGYAWKILFETYISVFIHRSNSLFQCEKIRISDLNKENFIAMSPVNNSNYVKLLTKLCEENSFTPKISVYVSSAHSFLMNLLKGNGIVLADNYTDIRHKDVKMFILHDIPAGVVIAWPKNSRNTNIDKFMFMVDTELHSNQ